MGSRFRPPTPHLKQVATAFLLATLMGALQEVDAAAAGPRRVDATRNVGAVDIGGVSHVFLDSMAQALGAQVRLDPDKTRLELLLPGRRIVFTLLSPYFVLDGLTFHLPHPVRLHKGRPVAVADPLLALLTSSIPAAGSLRLALQQDDGDSGAPEFRPAEADSTAWAIETVVIDPGHGGRDPGALGRAGTREKEVVLKIANRLRKLLERRLKVRVVLTRTDDSFVPLRERARIAIRNAGRIFVSLHCNASSRSGASGTEVFFLSEAKTSEAAEVARMENAALQFEDEETREEAYAELEGIARGMLSTQFLKESQDLAADIRQQIGQRVPKTVDRGVKQANFFVMRGTMGAMPSVLVEVGFISNRSEERRLRSAAHQKQVADAVCRGIETFKRRYEGTLANGR